MRGSGIIERIENDKIHLRSGDDFVVHEGTIVMNPNQSEGSFRIYKTDVLEPGMAIAYSFRDGKMERIVLVGIVETAPSGESAFDTIKQLGLMKGAETTVRR